MIQKDETNNCIVTRLSNVRKHPNADRLKLATVLGTQVIVGLDSKDGDLVLYFDSNLRLSHEYLHHNNLYSDKELNKDQTVRGYFPKTGRVKAQRFRGEISNGYVADIDSLCIPDFINYNCELIKKSDLKEGDEFQSINGVKICEKYVIVQTNNPNKPKPFQSTMFHKHWDTKQLMRELDSIPDNAICYIEEKLHGTSGRTANVLCKTNRGWKFWKPKKDWKIVSGTRRVDDRKFHLPDIREEIERRVASHLHKGEQIYYEIYGYEGGKEIQSGFHYDCRPGEWKVMLYRVTITTPDGFCIDLDRESVYKRAEELGLEKPYFIDRIDWSNNDYISTNQGLELEFIHTIKELVKGNSRLDCGTLCEGVVVWFKDKYNKWTCLKHKSEEFLIDQDKRIEKGQGDSEDLL